MSSTLTASPPLPEAKPKNGKFILIAEDDHFYGNIYKVKLTKEGYDVLVVGNGEWVIPAAEKRRPDLILLDLVMPSKDGFETLKEIKSHKALSNVTVVVFSNLGQEVDINKAKSLGATDYFVKTNVSLQEVIDKIKYYTK